MADGTEELSELIALRWREGNVSANDGKDPQKVRGILIDSQKHEIAL